MRASQVLRRVARRTGSAVRRRRSTITGLSCCLLAGVVLAVPAGGSPGGAPPSPARPVTAASAPAPPTDADLVPASRRRPARTPAAAPPAAPAAPPPDTCAGDGWQQRRGEAALQSLLPQAHRSGFRVTFSAARGGYLGVTWTRERRSEVFVRPCEDQSDALLRHVVAHELGHAFDAARMDDRARAAWKRVRGIPAGVPWAGCSGCSDFATPAGDFAEVFAQWARGATDNRSRLGGTPDPDELQRLAQEFFGA